MTRITKSDPWACLWRSLFRPGGFERSAGPFLDAGKFTRSTANSMPSRDRDQPMVAVGFWEHLDSNPHCHVLVAASDDTSDRGYWDEAITVG